MTAVLNRPVSVGSRQTPTPTLSPVSLSVPSSDYRKEVGGVGGVFKSGVGSRGHPVDPALH